MAIWLAITPPADGEASLADAIAIEGSVECLRAETLAEKVAAWSGHESVPVGVTVVIVHEAERVTMTIVGVAEQEVVRTFEPAPARCEDVEIAVGVALAVALDGEAVAEELDRPVDVEPEKPAPAPAPAPETVPAAAPLRTPPSLHLAFGAGVSFGVFPRVGLELASEIQIRWRMVALVAGIDLGASPSMPLGPGRADAVRVAVHAGVCLPAQRNRFSLALCAIGIGGPTIASARRIAGARTDVVPWIATLARLDLGIDVSPRWTLVLGNELVTSWIRPAIVARDPNTGAEARLRTPLAGWRGMFGTRVRLGSPKKPRSTVKRQRPRGMDGVG